VSAGEADRHASGAGSPAESRRTIQYQEWRDLLFLHWPVPPEDLREAVPARLSLDRHQGMAYVGVIAFAIFGVRPPLVPRMLSMRFLETNVRTYVTLSGREPGIYFFSLDAASRVAVALARLGFGLPYYHARMRLRKRGDSVEYRLRRSGGGRTLLGVDYQIGQFLGPSLPGSLEHFLIERYRFHLQLGEEISTCQVRHAPYALRSARVEALEENLLVAAGLPPPSGLPPIVHYSPGVDVEVLAPVKRDARMFEPEGGDG